MERNLEQEMDALKQEVQEIRKMLEACLAQSDSGDRKAAAKYVGHVQKMPDMHPDPHIRAILDRLENTCGENGESGAITYLGVFASGGRQSSWVRNEINTDGLLTLIENGIAEKVLACIGSSDRLNILLAILRKPRTVAELIEECHLSSSGQAYHHMKSLLAVNLIREDSHVKGSYIVQPHKVQGIIMLLAGICDMVDENYTQGNWEAGIE